MKIVDHIKKTYSKYETIILTALVIIFSSLGTVFAYYYGSTNPDVSLYANLMALDAKGKEQSINFLHGYYEQPNTLSEQEKYKENLKLQYKTIYKHRSYNTYLIATNKNGITNYSSELHNYNTEEKIRDLGIYNVAMVRNYWDYEFMEGLGLPLFYHSNSPSNRINSKKAGISFGAFISSSQAFNMSVYMGYLDEGETNKNIIKEAFTKLISEDNNCYLSLTCQTGISTFDIRNIYIDKKFSFLLNEFQSSEKNKKVYGEYYKSFSCWNENTIFTYSEGIFSQGSRLCFDINDGYNNIDQFINKVLSRNYSIKGGSIHFQIKGQNLESYSKNVDIACKNKNNGTIILIVLSVVFFEALLICYVSLLSKRSKKKAVNVIRYLLPIFPFVILWTFVGVFALNTSLLSSIYFVFNYLGNAISLIFFALFLLFGIVWRHLDEEDVKVI